MTIDSYRIEGKGRKGMGREDERLMVGQFHERRTKKKIKRRISHHTKRSSTVERTEKERKGKGKQNASFFTRIDRMA